MQRREQMTATRHRAVRRVLVAALTALLAFGVPLPAVAAAPADRWTGPFGDAGNTSTNAGERSLTAARAARVAQAWEAAAGSSGSSPQAPVVVKGLAYWISGRDRLVATSAVDGTTRWTLRLKGGQDYSYGFAASGTRLAIAFRGASTPSGVAVVDLTKRKVVWRSLLPNESADPRTPAYPGTPYTDGTRVLLSGGDFAINAFRLSDGRLLWRKRFERNVVGTSASVDGIAAGGGLVYTSGQNGLVALRATTGKQVWRSKDATHGRPVLTGSRVVVANGQGLGVESYLATGCRATACAPAWQVQYVEPTPAYSVDVAAADATHVYLTYETSQGSPGACTSGFSGRVTRLSASTGATEWTTAVGTGAQGLVHGGDVLWLYTGGIAADCTGTLQVTALPATGRSTEPLRTIDLGPTAGFPQTLSVAGGTLFRQDRLDPLTGYRVDPTG